MITITRKPAAPAAIQEKPALTPPVYRFEIPVRSAEPPVEQEGVKTKSPTPIATKAALLSQVQAEYNKTLLSRKALSNTINLHLARNASQEEMRELYDKIKAYQPVLEDQFNRIRHVEQYGVLPEAKISEKEPDTIASLILKRKALVDEKCKTKKKIDNPGKASAGKILEWQQKLDRAIAEYIDIDETIRKLKGKA